MTVIAYRDGIMAADGSRFAGDTGVKVATSIKKIRRTPDGGLAAACGDVPTIQAFHDWVRTSFRDDRKPGKVADQSAFGAVLVTPEGKILRCDGDMTLYETNTEYEAQGSHESFLLGALAAGATAEQAVRLAVQFCAYAGGDVQVERLRG